MILYLHGFRSSPQSFKATLMARAMAERGLAQLWRCPQLPASPREAARLAGDEAGRLLAASPGGDPARLTVVGSSLGGYYATWLAERLGCRAALLNPAVHPARDLAAHVGAQRSYHGDEPFLFRPEYLDELLALQAGPLADPGRYFLLACTGDEVLDWREMAARYAGCRQRIVEGGDHGISDFARWLPEVLAFALEPAERP